MTGNFRARDLEKAVIPMIELSVGDRLTTIKVNDGTGTITDQPSVILAREFASNGKVAYPPDYPFVMLETTGVTKSHDLISQYLVDGDLPNTYDYVWETTITGRLNIKVYGTRDNDIEDISSDLDQAFNVDDYRDLIDEEYDGCRWIGTSEINTSYNTIQDVYQGVSSFDAYFSIVRQHIQKNVYTFDTIIINDLENALRVYYEYFNTSAGYELMQSGDPVALAGYKYIFGKNPYLLHVGDTPKYPYKP